MNTGLFLLEAARSSIPGVIMLGLGMVFVGLISIIIICKIMGMIFGAFKAPKKDTESQKASPAAATNNAVIENRQEIIAAVSAAVAEELGTEVSALRIISFKKI